MPKDEFDFDDPMELTGVTLLTDEDTQREMAECFVEEFLMLGYNHVQLLSLFRNPHYLGMNMVLQNKGEAFVKEIIAEVFARWGVKVDWAAVAPKQPSLSGKESETLAVFPSRPETAASSPQVDPLGCPIPKLNL